jgi:hypothetical protein
MQFTLQRSQSVASTKRQTYVLCYVDAGKALKIINVLIVETNKNGMLLFIQINVYKTPIHMCSIHQRAVFVTEFLSLRKKFAPF